MGKGSIGLFHFIFLPLLLLVGPSYPGIPAANAREFSLFKEIDGLFNRKSRSFFNVKLFKFVVKRGDNLSSLLKEMGIDSQDIHESLETLKFFYNPKSLKIGQEISAVVHFFPNLFPHSGKRLQSLSVKTSPFTEIYVERHLLNDYLVSEKEIDFEKQLGFAQATIESNLYDAVQKMGLPHEIMAEAFHALSYDVDFERDVQVGNTFRVVYEQYFYLNGEFSHFGKIAYASLELDDFNLAVYRHQNQNQNQDEFFMSDGTSVKKSLMKTPIPSASVSSNYGMRRHPISTYTRLHKGVDFRAPRGTPILAAGDGVVQYKGRRGGYGKYLMIRHHGGYTTAYAHLSRFAKNLSIGQHVKQGEVVGFVGSTGRATGPHLHYELLYKGTRMNPLAYQPAPGTRLKGEQLKIFLETKTEIHHFIEEQMANMANPNLHGPHLSAKLAASDLTPYELEGKESAKEEQLRAELKQNEEDEKNDE